MSITNTYPESCFIDYMKALISGDHYQLMPKKVRVRELQTKRGKTIGKKHSDELCRQEGKASW